MAELFSTSRTNFIEHINNIYLEEELDKNSTCQNFRQVQKEGNRNVSREIPFYNLDMIISLGYRIKSKVATNFRKWATERLKEYMRNLKNAFKFIFSSSRLRSLIYFNAIMISLIYLLTSYRRSLFADIGISAQSMGIIYAALGLISSIYSGITPQLHKIFRNKMLTYMGLYFSFSIFLSGLAVFLNLPFNVSIIIVLASQAIQFGIKGPYYTLIKQYLSSFASSSMRVKIISASNLIEGFISGLVSLLGAFLLTKMSTSAASIIIGISFFILIAILLNYMKTHVGLKPEEYSNREINFKEVE